jgi:Helix-turn-helix domain
VTEADELIEALRLAGQRIPPSRLMSAAQLRKYLGVCDRTLQAWRAQGKPPAGVRLNGRWFYPVAEVSKFLAVEARSTTQNPAPPTLPTPPKGAQR